MKKLIGNKNFYKRSCPEYGLKKNLVKTKENCKGHHIRKEILLIGGSFFCKKMNKFLILDRRFL